MGNIDHERVVEELRCLATQCSFFLFSEGGEPPTFQLGISLSETRTILQQLYSS